MPIFRRTLTVAAVTAVGTFAFALPAWAHTPDFQASCDDVTINLTQFSADGPNTVHISRDGQDLGGNLSPTTFGASTTIVVPEDWDKDTVTYRVSWEQGDLADDFDNNGKFFFEDTLTKPGDCEKDNPPANDNPPEDNPPTDTETTTPAKAPATTTAAPPTTSPAPVAAVNADKLANTGAGNTVPLLVVGTVLVAGGVGLTFMTRRRRSSNASS